MNAGFNGSETDRMIDKAIQIINTDYMQYSSPGNIKHYIQNFNQYITDNTTMILIYFNLIKYFLSFE